MIGKMKINGFIPNTPSPMNIIGNCTAKFAAAGKNGAQNKRGGMAIAFNTGSLIAINPFGDQSNEKK